MTSVVLRKPHVRNILALSSVTLAMLVLPFAFIDEKAARVIFYWCGYCSVAGTLYEVCMRKLKLCRPPMALSFLALGMVYAGWSVLASFHDGQREVLLITAGKRMVLAFFIMSYILHVYRENLYSRALLARLAWCSVIAGFTVATVYGIVQGAMTHERIVLGINRATLTAYGYSAVSLALATALLQLRSHRLRNVLFVLTAALSLYVVCLTETRSAMVIHTLLTVVLALRFFPVTRNPLALALVALAMAVGLSANFSVIESRAALTMSEYHSYQNNDDHTSLGSRFTMWKTGLLAFEAHPLGQTQQDRNAWIKAWLDAHGNPDSFALVYLDVHLHNEFIQYASVFGVAGVLILLCFYWSAIVTSARRWGVFNPVTAASLAFMLYGATDVLLTCIELIVIFSISMTLMTLMTDFSQSGVARLRWGQSASYRTGLTVPVQQPGEAGGKP
ncbi:O-antigen ligase family protein [Pantoea dispersa]|uniref:O-antigen ligase family protein n=1 Tax=Pantoea dispersa TaxID=59814 RepID=UPI001CA6B3FD|nr:O-antigen ligase family protein [Pantoea dispersa]QZY97798.1 O-antigen ligase family protein [Pantoea dispersa]